MSEATLPNGWAIATIDDLIGSHGVFRDGDWVESKDQDQNGQVRLIQLADIGDGEFRDKSSRFLTSEKSIELNCTCLEHGDILVARMPDPLGRACLFPLHGDGKFVTVVDVCVIRFGHQLVDGRYFMYILNSPTSRRNISDHQTGSTRKRISRGNLSTVEFPIAPLNEQHRIVAKIEELFSELDKGIEALKTAREQLKVYRQALLKHAFEGKLTAAWRLSTVQDTAQAGAANPDKLEPAAALLARIQTEREQRYQQQLQRWQTNGGSKPKAPKPPPPLSAEELAELPELPEGWVWVKFGAITENFDGQRIPISAKERETKKGEYPYYGACSIIDYVDGYLFEGDYLLIGEDGANLLSKSRPLAFAVSGKFWVNNHAHIVQPLDCCHLKYLEHQFCSRNISQYITGTAQPKLTQANLDKVPVAICALSEQQQIVQELESKLSEADQLDQTLTTSLQQAEALRQSILKRAFAGALVPQDENDEPASELLARIRAEREKPTPNAKSTRSKRNG